MATITPATGSGSAVSMTAASAGGDVVAFGTATRPVIQINNASGSSVTVTLAGKVACNFGTLHNQTQACAAGQITEIIPASYTIDQASATYGQVSLSYSATTSVTVGAFAS
ncbi:MAG: hypothetical protein ACXVXJ_04665 [Mycobacteriaceae bacterium]